MFSDETTGGFGAADLGRRVEPQTPQEQLKAFLKTLSPAERKQYLANMRQETSQPTAGAMPMLGDHGMNQAFGGFNMAQAMAGQQAGHLAGMINQTTNAIADENDRRFALSREMRRMGFEQWKIAQQLELERIRLENERMMARDAAANQIRALRFRDSQNRTGFRHRSFQRDPQTGVMRWMEDWEM